MRAGRPRPPRLTSTSSTKAVTSAPSPRLRSAAVAIASSVLALLVLIPSARSEASLVTWNAPTPADKSRLAVKVGKPVAFRLTASTTSATGVVHIAPVGSVQRGTIYNSADGPTAHAAVRWTPTKAGDYRVRFTASTAVIAATGETETAKAPRRTYVIHVADKVQYPTTTTLTDKKVARWAVVLRRVVVRAQPKASARAVTTLDTMTSDDTQNLVVVLERRDLGRDSAWYRVRLPILPNNSTGWVRTRYLGTLYTVHTHLYVDRSRLRATLKRDGKTIFTTHVGVGKSYWPTPRGEFYVRSKLTGFDDPVYGPIAFGTSARSAVLTDWPGGGFVGIHGTNQPEILPGRVSHGCIRMPNPAIVKLARLMPVGTPLSIR